MRIERQWRSMALLSCLAMFATGAAGENFVDNGEFDFDTGSWLATGSDPIPNWLTIDHDACGADSGSARLLNSSATAEIVVYAYSSCIAGIVGDTTYSLDGFLRFPPGQTRTGSVWISISWYESELDCTGDDISSMATSQLPSSNSDVWIHKALRELVSPESARTAEIRINLFKVEAAGELVANFDGIHLVAGNGYLFGDGFESDTLCRWSETEP